MKLQFLGFLFLLVFSACKEKSQNEIQFLKLNSNISAGQIYRVSDFPSKNITARNVDVWLPENYSDSKKYAVLYMHDGQMLFDATSTWNKQEWGVDETVDRLIKTAKIKDIIVVGIHNIAASRFADYFPKKAIFNLPAKVRDSIENSADKKGYLISEPTLNADSYLKFIVEELKPEIDRKFSTFKDKEHTAIMGSSMGGLISMYAICEYPTIFGSAACLSTHWIGTHNYLDSNPVPYAIFNYFKEKLPDPSNHRIYFDFGTETLDKHYVKYENDVDSILKEGGYTSVNSKNIKFEGADHTENAWKARLDIPITFLMQR